MRNKGCKLKIENAYELLLYLKEKNLLANKPKYWWPNAFSFEVVIGAILTQNTKWERVEVALNNLKEFLEFEKFLTLNETILQEAIKTTGFYRQKAKNLLNLAKNIKNEFDNFTNFQKEVTREWLLEQRGIGFESADAILCYGCGREVMVVDKYTQRLLAHIGYEFDEYHAMQEWLSYGIYEHWDQLKNFYEENINLAFARFHGKIVEYMK